MQVRSAEERRRSSEVRHADGANAALLSRREEGRALQDRANLNVNPPRWQSMSHGSCVPDEAGGYREEAAVPEREEAPVREGAPMCEGAPVREGAPVGEEAPVREGAPVGGKAPVQDTRSARAHQIGQADLWSMRDVLLPLLRGPLPVVPIDAFVGFGLAVRDSLHPTTYRKLTRLNSYARSFGNLLTLGTLHLAPATDAVAPAAVRAFVRFARAHHPILANVTIRVHTSERRALRQVLEREQRERTWAVIVFYDLADRPPRARPPSAADAAVAPPPALRYAIRLNYSSVPNTNWISNPIARGLDAHYQRYITSGFLSLQALVDEYAFDALAPPPPHANESGSGRGSGYGSVEQQMRNGSIGHGYGSIAGASTEHRSLSMSGAPASHAAAIPFPTAASSRNLFYSAVAFLLGLVMTMCYLLPVAQFTKAIVEEKERRLKQTMRMMGLRDGSFVMHWLVLALLDAALISIGLTLTLRVFIVHTRLSLLVAYVGIFSLGAFAFSLLLSTCFSSAKLAAVVAPIAFFAGVLPKSVHATIGCPPLPNLCTLPPPSCHVPIEHTLNTVHRPATPISRRVPLRPQQVCLLRDERL